ncbi:MAG: helix-turn-helix domain-containing protein [Egibacteraceae bacterium]
MMTVPEAARRTGRHPETIRRWIRAGRLRAHKAGTQHLIDEADLDAIIGEATVALPAGWERLDDGTPRPDWARLVADSRQGH